ncbi:MAG: pilus assembly protein N-terminal domain-containing protein [Hyphomicrobiales bacterium]|nr:pilus assembly protein N-terminal domain-containing protein [Hyphomicrobiales bacterium]
MSTVQLRRFGCAAALVLAQVAFGTSVVRADSALFVAVDRAQIIKVPEGATTLIIGNPLIADVTMLKNNQSMVITGKTFGVTNLIALDAQGKQIAESTVKVVSPKAGLIVMRGGSRETWTCAPDCQPTVALGDDAKYMGETLAASRTHSGAQTTSGGK